MVNILENMKAVPAGSYVGRINPQHLRSAPEAWKSALIVPLLIVGGPFSGRIICPEVHFTEGKNVARGAADAELLFSWAEVAGVTSAPDFTTLVRKLAASTHRLRTQFKILRSESKRGVEYVIAGVRIAADQQPPRVTTNENGATIVDGEVH